LCGFPGKCLVGAALGVWRRHYLPVGGHLQLGLGHGLSAFQAHAGHHLHHARPAALHHAAAVRRWVWRFGMRGASLRLLARSRMARIVVAPTSKAPTRLTPRQQPQVVRNASGSLLEAALLFGLRGLRLTNWRRKRSQARGGESRKLAELVRAAFPGGPPANAHVRDDDFTVTSATKILVAKSCPRASNWNN